MHDVARHRLRRDAVRTPNDLGRRVDALERADPTTPRNRPIVAGSRADGTAQASLLRALHMGGWIDDRTNDRAGPAENGPVPTRVTTGATTLTDDDYALLCDNTSGPYTVTLPAAAGRRGRLFAVKVWGAASSITLDGNASETIDGATSKTLAPSAGLLVVCNGGAWDILASIGTIT